MVFLHTLPADPLLFVFRLKTYLQRQVKETAAVAVYLLVAELALAVLVWVAAWVYQSAPVHWVEVAVAVQNKPRFGKSWYSQRPRWLNNQSEYQTNQLVSVDIANGCVELQVDPTIISCICFFHKNVGRNPFSFVDTSIQVFEHAGRSID